MILTHNGLRWYLLQFQCNSDTDKWHARPKTRRGRKEEPVVLAGVCMCADQRSAFRLRGIKKSRVICNDRDHRESCDRWGEKVEGNEVKALTARSSKRVVGYIQELNIAKTHTKAVPGHKYVAEGVDKVRNVFPPSRRSTKVSKRRAAVAGYYIKTPSKGMVVG